MGTTADIRNGLIINFHGQLYKVIEFQHEKRGRGGAFITTKLKNIKTGQILSNIFRSGEKIDIVKVDSKEMQYLYCDGNNHIFMDTEDYEQIVIPEEIFKEVSSFVKENEILKIYFHNGVPIDIALPTFVELKVTKTEPGVKGDTVTGGTKIAELETGYIINVPLFVNVGDRIKIDTRTGTYCERVK